jgi:hypothetical protein
MTSKEYKDNIQVFITEFLDYYRLNDLNFDISCWDLREYSSYSLHIGKIDNFVYQKFNINEYKDRLVSLLQNIITEYNVQTEPSLVNVYSHNRKGEEVKTMYFTLKAFSNTRFKEPIERIELRIIRKND